MPRSRGRGQKVVAHTAVFSFRGGWNTRLFLISHRKKLRRAGAYSRKRGWSIRGRQTRALSGKTLLRSRGGSTYFAGGETIREGHWGRFRAPNPETRSKGRSKRTKRKRQEDGAGKQKPLLYLGNRGEVRRESLITKKQARAKQNGGTWRDNMKKAPVHDQRMLAAYHKCETLLKLLAIKGERF